MKIFTIENETNNIMVHSSVQDAEAVANAERFRNETGLAKLGADWPAARLIDIWNGLPGASPVRKFTDRATAVSRIWKAIQTLGVTEPAAAVVESDAIVVADQPEQTSEPTQPDVTVTESAPDTHVAPHAPDAAFETAPAATNATRTKKAPKTPAEPGAAREGSKTSKVIAMLKREGGTSLEEIMTEMGWLKHTTRAMLSAGGSLTKKHGLVITSEKVDGKRVYSIKS